MKACSVAHWAAAALLKHRGHKLVPAPYIQDTARIKGSRRQFAAINRQMNLILDYLASRTGQPAPGRETARPQQ
ncbi:MAG: hypothetical protein JRJ56_03200 [Deltaproteobacteria bacterium]|nr:hypothetical protein [Deltaproteobacteria bacterium]